MPSAAIDRKALSSAALLSFCAGSLYAWSALVPALGRAFATSTEQAGIVFSVAIVAFTAAVYVTPRLGPRIYSLQGGAGFALLAALSLSVASFAPAFMIFVVAFSLCFGFCTGAIYMIVLNSAGLSSSPRLMTAVMVAAFGLGGAIFGPVLRYASEGEYGLRALMLVVICLSLASLIGWRAAPKFIGASEGGPEQETSPEAAKSALFPIIMIWLIFCLGSLSGLMTLGLATSIMESRGASVLLSSVALSGIALGNTLGRLSSGVSGARIPPSATLIASALLIAVGVSIAGLDPGPGISALGLIVIASGYGVLASGVPVLTGAMFGPARFAKVFSILFSAWGLAGLIAPWAAGRLFDSWGHYGPAFTAAFVATLSALALSLWLHIYATRHA